LAFGSAPYEAFGLKKPSEIKRLKPITRGTPVKNDIQKVAHTDPASHCMTILSKNKRATDIPFALVPGNCKARSAS
jgi:hypothetical protein